MVKIKEYKIRKSGKRGLVVTLPQVWAQDNGLDIGDKIEFYRNENEELVLKVAK